MRSLNSHLTEPGGHGHLPFHPGCPVCRAERLAGRLAREPVLSRRAQASLLAAVLALSTGGPAATIATADPSGDEGSAAPNEVKGPDEDEPGFDPGDAVPLPNEVPPPPAPVAGGDDDNAAGPVEGEPQEQVTATPPPAAPVADLAPAGAQPGAAPPAPPIAPAVPPPAAGAEPEQTVKRERRGSGQRERRGRRDSRSSPSSSAPAATSSPAATPAATLSSPATAIGATPTQADPAVAADSSTGKRSHVVRPGESLWSIAADQVGERATPASVAELVNRLWTINSERIGTGDRDLLIVGTVLRLP